MNIDQTRIIQTKELKEEILNIIQSTDIKLVPTEENKINNLVANVKSLIEYKFFDNFEQMTNPLTYINTNYETHYSGLNDKVFLNYGIENIEKIYILSGIEEKRFLFVDLKSMIETKNISTVEPQKISEINSKYHGIRNVYNSIPLKSSFLHISKDKKYDTMFNFLVESPNNDFIGILNSLSKNFYDNKKIKSNLLEFIAIERINHNNFFDIKSFLQIYSNIIQNKINYFITENIIENFSINQLDKDVNISKSINDNIIANVNTEFRTLIGEYFFNFISFSIKNPEAQDLKINLNTWINAKNRLMSNYNIFAKLTENQNIQNMLYKTLKINFEKIIYTFNNFDTSNFYNYDFSEMSLTIENLKYLLENQITESAHIEICSSLDMLYSIKINNRHNLFKNSVMKTKLDLFFNPNINNIIKIIQEEHIQYNSMFNGTYDILEIIQIFNIIYYPNKSYSFNLSFVKYNFYLINFILNKQDISEFQNYTLVKLATLFGGEKFQFMDFLNCCLVKFNSYEQRHKNFNIIDYNIKRVKKYQLYEGIKEETMNLGMDIILNSINDSFFDLENMRFFYSKKTVKIKF